MSDNKLNNVDTVNAFISHDFTDELTSLVGSQLVAN